MTKKILILDDDEDILYFCRVIFEALDFEVTSVTHTDHILALVKTTTPDIILIDNWMPEMSGDEATRVLKSIEQFKQIPVVLFSAANDLEAIAQHAGADAYIQKPFDLDDLEKLILSLLKAN